MGAERIFSSNKSKTKEQNKGAKGKQRSMNSSLRDRATSQDIFQLKGYLAQTKAKQRSKSKTKEHEFKFKRWSYIPRHLAAERIFSSNKSKTKEQNKGAKGKQRSMNSSLRDRATSQDI